jgi:hypothetical protein
MFITTAWKIYLPVHNLNFSQKTEIGGRSSETYSHPINMNKHVASLDVKDAMSMVSPHGKITAKIISSV